ncbi:MAG: TonB family protein [Bacteroidales bacterium]|nr:TonB family protein [Bacteroidales bacterium]
MKFDKSKQISQSYFVLKSDKKIKYGEYISYFRLSNKDLKLVENGIINIDDYIKQKGNYYNGKKEGEWIENISSSKLLKGKYKDEKKIGVWDTYFHGEKTSSFDYDNNKKVGIWLTRKENGKVFERYDFDNNIQLHPIIRFNISYPNIAMENEIQGTVKVKYHINSDCSIDNITIIQSLSNECDQAAINAIKKYGELFKKYNKNCEDKNKEKDFNFILY